MLQQTQVVTVIDYYKRFLKRFPTVKKLAAAELDQVLKLWEGLGYYRRARQMHAAAQQIVTLHKGQFPDSLDEVLALPGIGRYTAQAILSIADDQPLSVLEGNTIRVYTRLMNFQQDVTRSASQNQLWDFADSLVTKNRPGDLNQALMELGSQICHVKSPACLLCPVNAHCLALQNGDPESLPNKGTKKTKYESVTQVAVVMQRQNKVLVRLCQPGEHWSGLWDFPRITANESNVSEIVELVRDQTGLTVSLDKPFLMLKHAVTRYRITLHCFHATRIQGRTSKQASLRWLPVDELQQLAMSTTGRKIAEQLNRQK